ncbi:MAG: creatininase family protein [Planctomycetota bacterium]|nr:creatininase family protein [Planctomycetota bacterium]
MIYGDQRWIDIRDVDKENTIVVCPLASLEQHGHHLPLLTDTYLVTGIADRVHEKLGDKIALTPTLWLGASDHHLNFPGTITVQNTLYTEMIKSVLRCFVRAGFRRIFFLNGHGGNLTPGSNAITDMVNSCSDCDEALITIGSYWNIAKPVMSAEMHGMESKQLSHAGEYETSMMLHFQKDLVHMKQAKGHHPVIDTPFFSTENLGRVGLGGRFYRQSATGALGKPEKSTAKKGKSLVNAIVNEVCAFIEDFATWNFLPILKKD